MIRLLIIAALFWPVSAALAQQDALPASDEPLEITADGTLEWKRREKLFIADQNAMARQGETTVAAQTLTAHYREGPDSGMEIWQVVAEDSVAIRSRESAAFGTMATYDLDKGLAIMTGDDLRMTSPDQVVTADERFEYWVTDGRLNALGNARVERTNPQGQRNTLNADLISAILKDNEKGERVLHTLEAKGNVVIVTPTETVTGAYGIYRAETNKAELTGGVTIKRGPNILEGERADVDLNSNTSRLFGGQNVGGQVRGVFFPGSEKKPDN